MTVAYIDRHRSQVDGQPTDAQTHTEAKLTGSLYRQTQRPNWRAAYRHTDTADKL